MGVTVHKGGCVGNPHNMKDGNSLNANAHIKSHDHESSDGRHYVDKGDEDDGDFDSGIDVGGETGTGGPPDAGGPHQNKVKAQSIATGTVTSRPRRCSRGGADEHRGV